MTTPSAATCAAAIAPAKRRRRPRTGPRPVDPETGRLCRLAEAAAAASVVHPAIVRTFHVDVSERGQLYQIMELVPGHTLAHELLRGRYDAAQAARWEARSPDVVLGRMLALQVRAAASEQAAAAELDRAGALAAAASARMDGADAGLGRDVRAAEREAAAAERSMALVEALRSALPSGRDGTTQEG